jgi:hypothetical protein
MYAGAVSEPKTRQIIEGADLVLDLGGVNLNDPNVTCPMASSTSPMSARCFSRAPFKALELVSFAAVRLSITLH